MSSETSSGKFRVHQQSNGARVVVTDTFSEEPEADEADVPGPARPRPKAKPRQAPSTASRGKRRGWWGKWRGAVLAGAGAALACSIAYNAIVLSLWWDFKLLAAASGTAIGLAVRGAAPAGISPLDGTPRTIAIALTYLCIASVYTPWFYDAQLHPEAYEVLADARDVDDAAVASFGADTRGPAVSEHAAAAVTAVGQSLALPFVLLTHVDVLGLLFLGVALAQAWKFSA
jgi:hypothetical protein